MSEEVDKKEKEDINNNNIDTNNTKTKKKEVPHDQDIIDVIKKVDNPILKTKLLYLNKFNTDLIDTKQINYKPEYVILRNKYELKYFDTYQKIIDIAVGNKLSDELVPLTKEEMEKYNIKEDEKEEKKPIENFFTIAIRNAKFFPFNKKDSSVLEYLTNIKTLKLDNNQIEDISIFSDINLKKLENLSIKNNPIRNGLQALKSEFFKKCPKIYIKVSKKENEYKINAEFNYPKLNLEFFLNFNSFSIFSLFEWLSDL